MDERPLTQAELDKIIAETVKVRNDEIRAAELHAESLRKAQIEAEVAALGLSQLKRQDIAALADDLFNRHYPFRSQVDHSTAAICINKLEHWHRVYPGQPITVDFFSPGGNLFAGLQLFDAIRSLTIPNTDGSHHEITTRAIGVAASMAGILLQAGSTRVMTRESWLLIHEVQSGAQGSLSEIKDTVKLNERVQDRIIDIFMDGVEKSVARGTTSRKDAMTKAKFKKSWIKTDWWVTADEALRLGFIDEIQ